MHLIKDKKDCKGKTMGKKDEIAKDEKKQKKPWSKKKKIIFRILMGVLSVFLIAIIAYGIIVGPVLFEIGFHFVGSAFSTDERIDVTMTEEERLEDLACLYEVAVADNPHREEFERLYDIDFDEMYAKYQEYVRACQNDYEFYCICFAFLSDMPSGHTGMCLPSYGNFVSCGFQLAADRSLQKDENKYLYSWGQVLEEEIEKYDLDNMRFPIFVYVDGEYIATGMCDENDDGVRLISINGETPDEYIRNTLSFYSIEYDDIHQKTYRDGIFFNDKQGTPVTLLCERENGEEVTIPLYSDYMSEISFNLDFNMKNKDPYYGKDASEEDTSVEEVPEETSEKPRKKNCEIVEDEEHGLVYLQINSCVSTSEDEQMLEEMRDALTRYDKVIVDLRNNTGGSETYYNTYVYPLFFEKDEIKQERKIEMQLNEATERWAKQNKNKVFESAKIDKENGMVTYQDKGSSAKGNGIKDYQVYVLISQTTFSSADIIAYKLSQYDNVTLIGENTGGEGMDGSIFVWSMPNSHLTFSFSPGIDREITPSNSVYGTAPDVVCTRSVEAVREQIRINKMSGESGSYESRKLWDNVLWEAWKLCEE